MCSGLDGVFVLWDCDRCGGGDGGRHDGTMEWNGTR